MTDNVAAETAQQIRRMLEGRGWTEAKSQQFHYPDSDTAVEVGYVYGECAVTFRHINQRGSEVAGSTPRIERGTGEDFAMQIIDEIRAIEADAQ